MPAAVRRAHPVWPARDVRRGAVTLDASDHRLAAAVGNAAITGGLSGPAVRYQARLAWLFAFAPVALVVAAPAGASIRQAVKRRLPA